MYFTLSQDYAETEIMFFSDQLLIPLTYSMMHTTNSQGSKWKPVCFGGKVAQEKAICFWFFTQNMIQ